MAGTQKRLDYPRGFAGELQRLGDESVASLEDEPDAAKAKAFEQLDLVEQAEAAAGHPLHKGQPLFNVAVAESARSLEGARGWFVAAYIEDARLQSSAPFDTPAAAMLTMVYGYTPAELPRVAEWAATDPAGDPVHLGMLIAARDTSDPLELPFLKHASEEDLDALDRGGTRRSGSCGMPSYGRSGCGKGSAGLAAHLEGRPIAANDYRPPHGMPTMEGALLGNSEG